MANKVIAKVTRRPAGKAAPAAQAKRAPTNASTTTNPDSRRAPAPNAGGPQSYRVRIRMYRQGVGDAFLLSFNTPTQPAHILIDCGVLMGTPDAKGWAQRIAQNVEKETGGRVNAVVGTHPHWDHLSGFHDAADIFGRLKVDEVWLSWAENPADAKAREMKRGRALQLDAVRRALAQLAAADDASTRARAAAIDETLSFQGPAAVGADGLSGTEAALASLRKLAASPRYFEPGDLITNDWLAGVRIYVLAPPRDDKLLSKMLGKTGSEMYGLSSDSGFYAALLAGTGAAGKAASTSGAEDVGRPFDASLCWSKDEVRADARFESVVRRYESAEDKGRTIENEWLFSAEQLALQFDSVVNNLSLVLAFEFVATGDVLLFAADAQVGNWLSWQSLSWKVKDGTTEKTVGSKDLLGRTVFYKVGHHGSHNATLMDGGLEAMVHPDLVGAIPVDEMFANTKKKWDMPAKPLYPHLVAKTRGRLLRADGTGATATDPKFKPDDESLWKAFAQRVAVEASTPSLFVDYFVP